MINKKSQAVIEDVVGKNPVTLDVNFDEAHPECVKITLNGKESIVKYTDLFSFLFVLATKEQQAKMIPVKEELGYQYMKQVRVKLSKDLKAGEEMVVNVPINVPKIIEDEIKFELEQGKTSEDLRSPIQVV